jgi:hypothetical protein
MLLSFHPSAPNLSRLILPMKVAKSHHTQRDILELFQKLIEASRRIHPSLEQPQSHRISTVKLVV